MNNTTFIDNAAPINFQSLTRRFKTTSHRHIARPDILTIKNSPTVGEFRALAQQRGWSEDWLVEQCKDEMDRPRETIREILAGWGMTKPRWTGDNRAPERVSLNDTALVWAPLLRLYVTRAGVCPCGCESPLTGKHKYASGACRVRTHRVKQGDRPQTSSEAA